MILKNKFIKFSTPFMELRDNRLGCHWISLYKMESKFVRKFSDYANTL